MLQQQSDTIKIKQNNCFGKLTGSRVLKNSSFNLLHTKTNTKPTTRLEVTKISSDTFELTQRVEDQANVNDSAINDKYKGRQASSHFQLKQSKASYHLTMLEIHPSRKKHK